MDAYSTATEQAKMGHEVTVFTPFSLIEGKDGKGADNPPLSKGERIVVKVILLRPWFRFGNSAFLPQLLWKLRGFDIVHLHFPFFGGAEWVWLLKLFLGKKLKLVIRYHMDVVGKGWLWVLFRLYTRFMTPLILQSADSILVSSFDYVEHGQIRQFYSTYKSKFFEIPFGVDTERFFPTRRDDEVLARHGLRHDDRIILFVGGLDSAHYFKGLEYLMQALALIATRDAKLLIVGQCVDLEFYYHTVACHLGLEKNVIFVGTVSNIDLPKYYNLCDVFVLASIDSSEAFGIVYLEALACEKPVIGSDLPGVRTVIDNGRDGFLVVPKDVPALAGQINFLLSDPALCQSMGHAGRKKILNRYQWQLVAKEINEVYVKVSNDEKLS